MVFNYPRILHMFWYGRMPLLNFLTVVSFRHHHPCWRIKIYTGTACRTEMKWSTHEHDDRFVTDIDYFPKLSDYGVEIVSIDEWIETEGLVDHHFIHQSDMLRIYQLWKEGGVWSDFDILYIKSIEDVIRGERDVLIFTPYYFPVGFLVCQPDSSLFRQIFEYQKTLHPQHNNYQMYGVVCMGQFLSEHKELLQDIDLMPREVYLPADWRQLDLLFRKKITRFPSITVGIHWFNGSKMAQEYMKQLCLEQFDAHCTMDHLIQQYLPSVRHALCT